MVEAVGHCHRHEVAHRDLKPENVLYAGPEGTRSAHVLKVCDFGLSTTFGGGHHDLHRKVGTPGYVGPEVLTATEERGYGPECDLWSLGVILYVMLSGTMPFYGRDKAEVYRNTCSGAYAVDGPEFAQISHDAVGLIHQLLVVDPARRLTPDGVFAHPWMAKDHVVNCVEIKILRRVRPESPRRPPRHRRDACSMAWRCRFLAARPSQDSRVIAEK
jgi:serine/threonine protein kinase